MLVLITERVSPSLRGELTRWLLEPHPCVFVGTVSAMVRDRLWQKVESSLKSVGAATLIVGADNEQGFTIRNIGETARTMIDFEGLQLVLIPEKRMK